MKHESDRESTQVLPEGTSAVENERVVVHLKNGDRIKGYLPVENPKDLLSLIERPQLNFTGVIKLTSAEDKSPLEIDSQEIEAVYFVRSFTGDKSHEVLRYYTHGPEVGAIWVEVQFKNNEIMEGTIHNSMHHLIMDGFFLHPSDPGSNNRLVYIYKNALKDYRVLGVRRIANR